MALFTFSWQTVVGLHILFDPSLCRSNMAIEYKVRTTNILLEGACFNANTTYIFSFSTHSTGVNNYALSLEGKERAGPVGGGRGVKGGRRAAVVGRGVGSGEVSRVKRGSVEGVDHNNI